MASFTLRKSRGGRSSLSAAAILLLLPCLAAADHELYSDEQSKLIFKGTVMGAAFVNSDSWFGQSEEFLGDDTDTGGDFGAELD